MIYTVTLNPALDKTIRISDFKIGNVCRVEETRMDAGGKGINVSKVIDSLGGSSIAMGIVGGSTGRYIKEALDDLAISHDFQETKSLTRTNLKIVDSLRLTNTDINEAGPPVTEQILQQVWQKICDRVTQGDMVVFAGKNPPGTPDDLLAKWIMELKEKGARVAVDTCAIAMKIAVAAGPTIIKPNVTELEELCECSLDTESAIVVAAQNLVANGVGNVVVSMGAEGALFVTEQGVWRAEGAKVVAESTVGAGDSMLASVLLDMEEGRGWEEIAARAVAVSAAKVMCTGTQPGDYEDVMAILPHVKVHQLT